MIRKPETIDDPFAPDREAHDADPVAPSASPASKGSRRGWRRLLQVNLLMVLVALGLVSGYFAMRRNLLVPYLEQREAMDALSKKGAQFASVPARPRWVQTLFGISDDDFQNVEMIKLEHSENLRDGDLVLLHKFPRLTRLYLASTRVTDEGMKHLRYCTRLRRVSLWDTTVGDAGIAELETLTDLRILDLHRTWTTDDALATLGKLPAIEELVLDDATTSRGIAHLAELENLRRLDIRRTHLRAECLAPLANCPIEILEMPNGFLDRENAKHLANVPRLRKLSLGLEGATDEELRWLGRMTGLRELLLVDVKAEGRFAEDFPNLRRLERMTIRSDRLRKEHLDELLSPPRLKEATLSIALSEEDLPTIPRRPVYLRVRSPWLGMQTKTYPAPHSRLTLTVQSTGNQTDGTLSASRGDSRRFEDRAPLCVRPDDLAPLLAQQDLEELMLSNWEFAPGALASLASLKKLTALSLDNCRFEQEELAALASLPELRFFRVTDAPVGDEALAAFVQAPKLTSLEIHLTDASNETALALAKKESMVRLSISSTTLDDGFLDAVEEILAPDAQRRAEEIVFAGAFPEAAASFSFRSVGFSFDRAKAFSRRFQIASNPPRRPTVKKPAQHLAEEITANAYGGTFDGGEIQPWLSPMKFEAFERPGGERGSRAFGPFVPFAEASPLPAGSNWDVWGRSLQLGEMHPRQGPWEKRLRVGPIGEKADQRVAGAIPLDRFEASGVERALDASTTYWSLSHGNVPDSCLEAIARSQATTAGFLQSCGYDADTLRAVARMPNLRDFLFTDCRKPTPEEIGILLTSATLETVHFEQQGDPVYFRDVRGEDAPIGARLSGKIVYDVADAMRVLPRSLIFANLRQSDLESLVSRQSEFAALRARDDWHNHRRVRFRLEGIEIQRQLEAKEAAAAGSAVEQSSAANLVE